MKYPCFLLRLLEKLPKLPITKHHPEQKHHVQTLIIYYKCGKEHKRTWECCRSCPGGRCERFPARKAAVAFLALNRCDKYRDCLVCKIWSEMDARGEQVA